MNRNNDRRHTLKGDVGEEERRGQRKVGGQDRGDGRGILEDSRDGSDDSRSESGDEETVLRRGRK